MPNSNSTYIVKTLGCKANLYDSQLIEAELQKRGWTPYFKTSEDGGSGPALCIVNSCTVTDEADRQSRKTAARLSRDNPATRVVVTGCAAEVDPERLAQSKGIDYVIGNRNKPDLVGLILQKIVESSSKPDARQEGQSAEILGQTQGFTEMLSRHPMDRDWYGEEGFLTPPVHLEGHSAKTRAFLKIQEGCNSFCTYCIIPYGRGPSRSVRPRELIEQIRSLVSQGIREVVITGTNVGDYGTDWSPEATPQSEPLVELFRMILSETTLERLRVSSLDPVEITPELRALAQSNSRFCPHFHVSLQSAHSRTLRMMKRKYQTGEVKRCLESIAGLRAPVGGVFVGMDVITGFPGETDEEFEEGYQLLSDLPWSRLHVFPYSERKGTPATRLPGAVPQDVRVKRARRLSELSLKRMTSIYQRALDHCQAENGSIDGVLLERFGSASMPGLKKGEWVSGYSTNYLRILVPIEQAEGLRNQSVSVVPEQLIIDEAAGEVAFIGRLAMRTL
jgi:threonylcarbamoyladenosine tRNA methylthiotransferase MtaB